MADSIENMAHRYPGCEALLQDGGGKETYVPVCMGGTALAGCNNPGECRPLFGERVAAEDPRHAYVVFTDEETGRVKSLVRVAREPLRPVERASRD